MKQAKLNFNLGLHISRIVDDELLAVAPRHHGEFLDASRLQRDACKSVKECRLAIVDSHWDLKLCLPPPTIDTAHLKVADSQTFDGLDLRLVVPLNVREADGCTVFDQWTKHLEIEAIPTNVDPLNLDLNEELEG